MNIPILNGPGEYFGAKGDGLSIFIRDPDGTTIEIRTYEQDAINI
ncbi:VOC family protein [Algicola sagamiensis]|nr:hypothetical protein [Algicola sagamiensis]